eukprot:TRINITY_DN15169_c0_g1_i6.p1 TRINITY_DN15169_c0_g1~~TRINITY_DN15169_c0_g1_i6.p1  ORF type:complete len:297 (+),score=32.73 TRINITY_DN15169_c0_g1_i6:57-893(+)
MSIVRFLCPMTCQCATFPSTKSGLFGSPKFGCPKQCVTRAAAVQNLLASTGNASPCRDAGLEYFSQQRATCYYWAQGAWLMQSFAQIIGNASVGDEIDEASWDQLEATHRKRGQTIDIDRLVAQDVISLAPCPGHGSGKLPTGQGMSVQGQTFIQSALAGLRDESHAMLSTRVAAAFAVISNTEVSDSRIAEAVNSLLDGSLFNELQAGNWNLFSGVAHTRGLTYCAFLTSYEVVFAWNVDVCDTNYNSLRSICPISCGCQAHAGPQCPPSCARGANP